jgi:hypothetical protein
VLEVKQARPAARQKSSRVQHMLMQRIASANKGERHSAAVALLGLMAQVVTQGKPASRQKMSKA